MVKRLWRNMDIMDTMDDNTCPLTVHTVHSVHSSLREQQLSMSDWLRKECRRPKNLAGCFSRVILLGHA
ncbi:MAG: hypothetical protein GX945_14150 [Lentisphaerae bacterium]|nr:hypothetical protein [Lentisphaerota bacterium]